jgi:nucleoside-diphosphate-sugar epimerase
MKVLVTGGAGFIGRWVVKRLLEDGHEVQVLDNLTNGRESNLSDFLGHPLFREFVLGDIQDVSLLERIFSNKFDICYHLAASINVQDSIDNPRGTFDNDVAGTFNVVEECRKHRTKMVFMSTCMVYDQAAGDEGINENHPTKPASPYAGSKIAAENVVLSYYYAYGLPVVVLRPFNTYGPFQKSSGEGGVIAIFIERSLAGQTLNIYGDGTQTRDFLYVEDCARFVVTAGYSDKVNGQIFNAGTGRDIAINELALLIAGDTLKIKHVPHIHPQSEIKKLICDCSKAKTLLAWQPYTDLEKGIRMTADWIKTQM